MPKVNGKKGMDTKKEAKKPSMPMHKMPMMKGKHK